MSTERSLDEIMSEAREAPEGGAPPPAEDDRSPMIDRPRDERGRFAPRSEDDGVDKPPSARQQPEAKNVPDGYVPIQAMDARLAKSEERMAALLQQNQQMIAALQQQTRPPAQPQQAPDFFDNPDAAFEHRIAQAMTPVQQQLQAQTERFSSMMAVDKHGLEPVQEAYAALAQRVQAMGPQDPVYIRIMRSQHPYGELVRWHQEQSALQRYGSDPEAYINAEIERRMQERLQGQPGTRGPAPRMPTSFAGPTVNAGQRSTPGYNGPRPLSEIMGR